jgi:hypothetical protein
VTEVSDAIKSITIYGVNEEGGLSTAYEMTFAQKELMMHVYCALLSSDVSRYKTLTELFRNTRVPVIQPNSAKRTGNIIKKVAQDFQSYLTTEKLDLPSELAHIDKKLMEITAWIDATVFKLYGLVREEVQTVLNSLELTVGYRQEVLSQFEAHTEDLESPLGGD